MKKLKAWTDSMSILDEVLVFQAASLKGEPIYLSTRTWTIANTDSKNVMSALSKAESGGASVFELSECQGTSLYVYTLLRGQSGQRNRRTNKT